MFGRVPKVNPNYYISPHSEKYLKAKATTASIIAGVAAALLIPAIALWIAPGIGSLLWIYDVFEANIAYFFVFICTMLGLFSCFGFSFFSYKIRKKVMQSSAPTLGFKRSSYNGAFFTAVLVSLLLIFQIVLIIGYHVAVSIGYIAEIIAKHDLQKTAEVDVIGIIVGVFYALSAAASWVYYFFTFRVNRTMQLVMPDKTEANDAPAIPTAEEAEKHRPNDKGDSAPSRSTFSLTKEEIARGEKEFKDSDDSHDKDDYTPPRSAFRLSKEEIARSEKEFKDSDDSPDTK